MEHILKLLSEIGIIVEAQGEFINTIEAEINKANNYVERAEKHLIKAKKQHKRDRKVKLLKPTGLLLIIENVLHCNLSYHNNAGYSSANCAEAHLD